MNLPEQLVVAMQGKFVVMGIGNPDMGDDAAGSLVARRVGEAKGVRVIDAQEVPENHLRQVVGERPDAVVLIDAVDLHSAPGSVAFLDRNQVAGYWPSTHRVPLSLLMEYLARETCAHIRLIAIQPRDTGFQQPLSEEVEASVAGVAGVLNDVIAARRGMGEEREIGAA